MRQNTNFKKNFLGQNKLCKNALFRELQFATVLLLICDSYMSQNTRFVAVNRSVAFYIFNSVSLLFKFIFLLKQKRGLFNSNFHSSFQNKINRKATQTFAPRSLVFKLQEEVSKFNDTVWVGATQNLTWRQIF